MKELSKTLKIFFLSTYFITIFITFYFIKMNYISLDLTNIKYFLFFSILTAVTESCSVSFMNISFTTTFAVTIATYILFGPLNASLIFILGFLCRILRIDDKKYKHTFNTPFYGTLFNLCALVLPIFIGNYFFIISGGNFNINNIMTNFIPIVIFSSTYLVINHFIISILLSLHTKKNVFFCFINNMRLALLNYIIMIPFGVIIAVVFNEFSYIGVLCLICPILLVRYTFSLYMDTNNEYKQTVNAFMHAIEARDKYTEGHSQRVAEISCKIAKKLGYGQWKVEQIRMAAMLHDIGKIGISDSILNKPGKLTDEEYSIIKQHPVIGNNIIKDIKNLKFAADIIEHHHERYDGRGYPSGKCGDELCLEVYIVQLADAIDAMATDRPYRKALSKEEIISEIQKNIGTQFNPKIANIYLSL